MNAIKRFPFIVIISTTLATSAFAESLTQAELDLLVKEDIASAQVLTEICPALIGANSKFNNQIDQFTIESLKRLSQASMTLTQLQQDTEYQTAYKEAKVAVTAHNQADQKTGCEEILMADIR